MKLRSFPRRWVVLTGVAVIGYLAVSPAAALEPPYLSEFPTVEQIRADIRGTDRLDTLARQSGLLRILHVRIERSAGRRYYDNRLSADENRLMDAYAQESVRLDAEAASTFDPSDTSAESPRVRYNQAISRHMGDPTLFAEIDERYFSDEFRAHYAQAQLERDAWHAGHKGWVPEKEPTAGSDRTWNAMSPDERRGALIFAGLMISLLACGAWRELRRFGFDAADPRILRAGFRKYRIGWVSGVATNCRIETVTTRTSWQRRTPSGNIEYTGSTTNTYYQHADITHAGGVRHVRFSCNVLGEIREEGRRWTAVWAVRRWRKRETEILYIDRAVNRHLPRPAEIRTVVGARSWTILPAAGLGFMIGSSFDLVVGWHMVNSTMRGIALSILAAVAMFVIVIFIDKVRVQRIVASELPRLADFIDEQDQEPPAPNDAWV